MKGLGPTRFLPLISFVQSGLVQLVIGKLWVLSSSLNIASNEWWIEFQVVICLSMQDDCLYYSIYICNGEQPKLRATSDCYLKPNYKLEIISILYINHVSHAISIIKK
jgi:hypothetical protein